MFQRYFTTLPLSARISHDLLARICFNDHDREIALVAEHTDPATGTRALLGVGRLTKLHYVNAGEFGIVVGDPWQNQGLGTLLLDHLQHIAGAEKLKRLTVFLLADNLGMQQLCRRRGFQIVPGGHRSECRAEMGCEARQRQIAPCDDWRLQVEKLHDLGRNLRR